MVSSIKLKAQREAEIESSFSCGVEFLNSKWFKKFNDLLEDFKACSNTAKVSKTYSSSEEDIVNSGFSEKSKLDWLIVMDDVSGLAEESKNLQVFWQ